MEVQVFDLFIEQAESEELKEFIKAVKEMYIEKERLKNDIKRITEITNQKIKIINEVREYIENNLWSDHGDKCDVSKKEIFQILDRVGDKE